MPEPPFDTNRDPNLERARFDAQQADYFWCVSQPEVLQRYPGMVVVVHRRQVLGAGEAHQLALASVERELAGRGQAVPPRHELLFVLIPEPAEFGPGFFPEAINPTVPSGRLTKS